MGRTKGFTKALMKERKEGIIELCEKGYKSTVIRKTYPSLSLYSIKRICRKAGVSRKRGRPAKATSDLYARR